MPGTDQEYVAVVRRVLAGELTSGDALTQLDWADGTACSESEARWLTTLIEYEQVRIARPKRLKAQRRAMGLLRSFLGPEQLRSLKNNREFLVRGSLGGVYRIMPRVGRTRQVERHGKRLYQKTAYCLHDQGEESDRMPPADLALAHMLWLMEDEAAFLATANHTGERQMQWDGEWRRRLNRARRERTEAARAETDGR